jgi:flavodoxin I
VGLPLDDDTEPELTDERIAAWVEQLKPYLQ